MVTLLLRDLILTQGPKKACSNTDHYYKLTADKGSCRTWTLKTPNCRPCMVICLVGTLSESAAPLAVMVV